MFPLLRAAHEMLENDKYKITRVYIFSWESRYTGVSETVLDFSFS